MSRRIAKPWDEKIASISQEETRHDFVYLGLDVELVQNFSSALGVIEREARGVASMDITVAEIDVVKLIILRQPLDNKVFRLQGLSLSDRIILRATSFFQSDGDLFMQYSFEESFMKKMTSLFLDSTGFSFVRSMKVGRLRNRGSDKLTSLINHLCRTRPLTIAVELRNLSYLEFDHDKLSVFAPLQMFSAYVAFEDREVGEKFQDWLGSLQPSFDSFNKSLVFAAEATYREAKEIEEAKNYEKDAFHRSAMGEQDFQPKQCPPENLIEIQERNKRQLQEDLLANNLIPAQFSDQPPPPGVAAQPAALMPNAVTAPQAQVHLQPHAAVQTQGETQQDLTSSFVTALATPDTPKPQRENGVVRRQLAFDPSKANETVVATLNKLGANTQGKVPPPEVLGVGPPLSSAKPALAQVQPGPEALPAPETQAAPQLQPGQQPPATVVTQPEAPATPGIVQGNMASSPYVAADRSLFDMTSQLSMINSQPQNLIYPALPYQQQQPVANSISVDQLAHFFNTMLRMTPPMPGQQTSFYQSPLPAAAPPPVSAAPVSSAALPVSGTQYTDVNQVAPLVPRTSAAPAPASAAPVSDPASTPAPAPSSSSAPTGGAHAASGGQAAAAGNQAGQMIQSQAGAFNTSLSASRTASPSPSKMNTLLETIKGKRASASPQRLPAPNPVTTTIQNV